MATDDKGNPACGICAGSSEYKITEVEFDFTGRKAQCHCGRITDSSPNLAFLQIGGCLSSVPQEWQEKRKLAHQEFSRKMDEKVTCTVGDIYHARAFLKRKVEEATKLWNDFKKMEAICKDRATMDSYYCGCDGWD